MRIYISLPYVNHYFSGKVSTSVILHQDLMFSWLYKAGINKDFVLYFTFPLQFEIEVLLVAIIESLA